MDYRSLADRSGLAHHRPGHGQAETERSSATSFQNFTHNPYRRVDLQAQLDHTAYVHQVIALLKSNLPKIPNVLTNLAPDVEILTFTLAGPVLAVCLYCNNKYSWQVCFDTNRTIRDTGASAGLPAPEQHFMVRTGGGSELTEHMYSG